MSKELKTALNVMLSHCVDILSGENLNKEYLIDMASNVAKAQQLLKTECYRCHGLGIYNGLKCPRCNGTKKAFSNGFLPDATDTF